MLFILAAVQCHIYVHLVIKVLSCFGEGFCCYKLLIEKKYFVAVHAMHCALFYSTNTGYPCIIMFVYICMISILVGSGAYASARMGNTLWQVK